MADLATAASPPLPPALVPSGRAPAAHHRLSVHGNAGPLHLAFEAALSAPWTVLFGPSGCGKSTLLRAMGGLLSGSPLRIRFTRCPDEGSTGSVLSVLQDAEIFVAPERRQLAYAPQQAALFPHLTVLENVAFATAVRGQRRPRSSDRSDRDPGKHHNPADLVATAMQLLDLNALARRRPSELSGGERQRVSLARALAVPGAQLLLLDEPFAGVDRALRDALVPGIQRWLADRRLPTLSVTHDVDEALLLNAEVIRLTDGQNTAQGPGRKVLAPEIDRLSALLERSRTGQAEI